MRVLFFLSICVLSCMACTTSHEDEVEATSITFIFQKSEKPQDRVSLGGERFVKISGAEIDYTDSSGMKPLQRDYDRDDTLTVYPVGEYIIFRHRYKAINWYDYIFKKGDTVLFTYEGEKPVAGILNRKVKPFDLNTEAAFTEQINSDSGFSARNIYDNPYLVIDWSDLDFKSQREKIKEEALIDVMDDYRREKYFLDSLKESSLISDHIYAYFSDKVKYSELMLAVNESRLSLPEVTKLIEETKEPSHEIPYSFYDDFLETVAHHFYVETVPTVDMGTYITYDYRMAYDSIAKSMLFGRDFKTYLLSDMLRKVADNFSHEDFITCYKKFEQLNDTAQINKIKNEYFLDFDALRSKTDSIYLMTPGKKKVTLGSVLKAHAGKLVYLDVWASWCAPCRKEMPHSKALRESYAGKDFVVIYLSIDQRYDPWIRGAREEGLEMYKESYLVVNFKTADFFTALNVRSIPRYILLDKSGKVLYEKAPGPGSAELKKLVDKRLEVGD